ncbi:MAG: GGDEF domain-containing protein [Desulfurella sp.]
MQKQHRDYMYFLSQICDKFGKVSASQIDIEQKYAFVIDNLINIAYKDHLTKLYNRRYFEKALSEELCRFNRYGFIFSLCIMDINDFKQINDTYGHLKVDEVLQYFSDILINNSRTSDILCRWGGDEFAVILPHTTFNKIGPYVKKIFSALETPKDNLLINISIGATSITLNDNKDSLLERADEALYKAKKDKTGFHIL